VQSGPVFLFPEIRGSHVRIIGDAIAIEGPPGPDEVRQLVEDDFRHIIVRSALQQPDDEEDRVLPELPIHLVIVVAGEARLAILFIALKVFVEQTQLGLADLVERGEGS
jgi:hypothetical protein